MEPRTIPVNLSVCRTHSEGVEFNGQKYEAGFRGPLAVETRQLDNDKDQLEIDLSEWGAKPRICDGQKLAGVSIRYCPDTLSVIGIYENLEMNLGGCCESCTTSDGRKITCYGSSWCEPNCF